ncbi:MAG: DsrH/TusB family sulfur metabolism protein [Candidatus Bathycorpusculaceae bacterium]
MAKILYFVTDMDPTGVQLALEHKDSDVGICLLQDAVYYGCKGRNRDGSVTEAIKSGIPVYAAKRDVELRGLTKLLHEEIKVLDYSEIIDLIFSYERIVNI